ncbi:hypothetical protein UPYG_G00245750 [Umbra pygmaea]|uniref:Uncharacterized protein n=1 Tax=Umbra pygmaea TaxID=75934 RepID=A0ABD0WH28_UMBPY
MPRLKGYKRALAIRKRMAFQAAIKLTQRGDTIVPLHSCSAVNGLFHKLDPPLSPDKKEEETASLEPRDVSSDSLATVAVEEVCVPSDQPLEDPRKEQAMKLRRRHLVSKKEQDGQQPRDADETTVEPLDVISAPVVAADELDHVSHDSVTSVTRGSSSGSQTFC